MPTIIPQRRGQKLAWYAARRVFWARDPAAVGLTQAQVEAFGRQLDGVAAAAAAQRLAKAAAETATRQLGQLEEALAGTGAAMLATIRAHARTSGDAAVYARAGLPDPAPGGPLPAPGVCYRLETQLLGDGALLLRWQCDLPAGATGTMYEIFRQPLRRTTAGRQAPGAARGEATGKVKGEAGAEAGVKGWTYLATAGQRSFLDETLPANLAGGVAYRITALRSTRRSNPAIFNVPIDRPGGASDETRRAA